MGRVFRVAERVAALALKVAKCHIVRLAGAFSDELAAECRSWLSLNIPEWQNVMVAPSLAYLGMWLGPL
eukprot:856935-Pyramimonas_sp.AAC.1